MIYLNIKVKVIKKNDKNKVVKNIILIYLVQILWNYILSLFLYDYEMWKGNESARKKEDKTSVS